MKTHSLLLLSAFVLSNTAFSAEVQEFKRGYVDFVEITNYTFEMKVTGQSKYSLNLASDKVMKQTTIKFSPTYDELDTPYKNFKFEKALPAQLDDTVSLSIDLDDLTENRSSLWFNETNVKLKETYSPTSTVVGTINNLAKAHNINDKAAVERTIKEHLYLASKYTEQNPYSKRRVKSGKYDQINETSTTDNNDLSQDVNVQFQNATVYVDDMEKDETRTQYIDSFSLYNSNSFVTEFIKGSEKQKNIAYTYFLYNLTGVLPVAVKRNLYQLSSDYTVYNVKNNDGSKGLVCVKKSEKRYTCQLTYKLTSMVALPSSEEVSQNHYPLFVTNSLTRDGMTNEKFRAESRAIELGTYLE
jgi:hypothetical protein